MEKDEIRQSVWTRLENRGVARFPLPIVGRIPNFQGSREAATRLCELDCWQAARALKANPDSPQRWVRRMALQEGKRVYMAVPRLTKAECFLELDPRSIQRPERAATIRGAFALGKPRRPNKLGTLDLVLAGSVAVDRKGGRVGKGGGYSDLEYALGREYGFLSAETPVVTTVHPLQLLADDLPMHTHDIPVDHVATSQRTYAMPHHHPKPTGIFWSLLSENKLREIPPLQQLEEVRGAAEVGR